jgi:hypothetical protein
MVENDRNNEEIKVAMNGSKVGEIPSITIPVSEDVLTPSLTRGVAIAMRSLGHKVTVGFGEAIVVDGEFKQVVEIGVEDMTAKRIFANLSQVAAENGLRGVQQKIRGKGGTVWEAPSSRRAS